ncbi:ParB N-terminal domain-containing protein [Leisingera caerulea]|uniref:ParB N-terminal domain-containing protein n=1 Tax=Leisingera caerulea TaxID=506591 RepID=UPI000413F713|nr:ParB/Srx family N-terminal domain-containing protein [Leisingera caerulea]
MRKICIGNEETVVPEEQPNPELAWVAIDSLLIDDRYQRPLGKSNWARIRKIASAFRWSRFSPILVSRAAGGGYAVVDGQHRVHAAKMCGYPAVPTMIVQMDYQEQARSFSWVNDQVTRISTFHIFKAALAAGDDWAVRCRDAVSESGCRLMTANSSTDNKKAGEIYAIALIRKLVEQGQGNVVTAGLKALRSYDETGRVPLYSAVILRPWLSALAANELFLELDLVQFLQEHDPYRVLNKLDQLRKESGKHGKTPAKLERDAFITLLNDFSVKPRR